MTDEALRELAWRAVVTPSLDAPEAFEVLTDALLERGDVRELSEPDSDERHFSTFRRVATVPEQAWTWAQETTLLPLDERIRLAAESFSAAFGPAFAPANIIRRMRELLIRGEIDAPKMEPPAIDWSWYDFKPARERTRRAAERTSRAWRRPSRNAREAAVVGAMTCA